VRRIAGRLRPGLLEDLGLISSLNALATEFTSHSGVQVRRGFAPGLPRLSGETELVIYRVTQEALTNIARHARASTVQLSLSRQGQGVTLRIADDGVGIRDAELASGIQGMQERALLVEGKLTIEPRVGGGTEIRLAIPNGDRP
jgi:two-component system sensor histidine kinase UhpB